MLHLIEHRWTLGGKSINGVETDDGARKLEFSNVMGLMDRRMRDTPVENMIGLVDAIAPGRLGMEKTDMISHLSVVRDQRPVTAVMVVKQLQPHAAEATQRLGPITGIE